MSRERVNDEKAVSASTVSRLTLRVLLAMTLILGVSAVLMLFLEHQKEQRAGVARVQAISQGLANRFGSGIALYSQVLGRYIAGNPRLSNLLQDEAWTDLEKHERQLTRLLPDAMRVRILPLEWDRLDPESVPPISFATLEMLRGVERSGRPSVAEVHQFGHAHPHIALAAPVRDITSGDLAGVVQLALPMSFLENGVSQVSEGGGRIELQQVVDAGSVALAVVGAAPAGVIQDGEIPVEGSLWRLVYWGGQGSMEPFPYWDTWGVLALGALLLGLVVVLLIRSVGKSLKRDQHALDALARSLLQGEGPVIPPKAGIPELQGVMDLLAHRSRGRSTRPAAPKPQHEEDAAQADSVDATAQKDHSKQAALGGEPPPVAPVPVSTSIFRAYDIRGVVGETLNTEVVEQIGRAIGSEAQAHGEQTVIIARDGRNSSETLSESLASGLVESGCEVVDLGMVPTPVLYFATHFLGSNSGVMVTGSHNPPEYNGLKIVIAGETLAGARIRDLHRRIEEGDLASGEGRLREQDLVPDYIGRISEDVQLLTPMKLVVDCGNGVASVVAPALFRVLGCDVVDLYCEVDGAFPNHHPDPGDPRNLQALASKVKEESADLGVAFDGDGDRLGVVDSDGKIIWPDRLLMLLARDVLLRQPGADVIYDVKSSRDLASEILTYGGRPIMWKSGHSLVKEKLYETGAVLAGELTGHIYFRERWYGFDDGLYACARLLEVLSGEGMSTAEVFSQLPESVATPALHAPTEEGRNFALVSELAERGQFPGAKLVTIDGIRAEFQDGWGLIRPSNTGPNVMFRFEAESEAALARIQGIFKEQVASIDPTVQLPF